MFLICFSVFKMQNCTSRLNQKCIVANRNEVWKCIIAQVYRTLLLKEYWYYLKTFSFLSLVYLFLHLYSPIFVLNSQYDTWQLHKTLQLKCTPPYCTPEEMEKVEQFFHVSLITINRALCWQNYIGVWRSCLSYHYIWE